MRYESTRATRAFAGVRARRWARSVDGHVSISRFFGDAPERASTADMAVDAGEAAAHARAVVTVFHYIAYSLAGFAFGFASAPP